MTLWQPAPPPSSNPTWTPSPSSQAQPQTQPQSTTSSHPTTKRQTRSSSPAPQPASRKIKYQGKRIGQVVKLKSEFYEEYKECHKEVWPEVLKQIKECNMEDYSIFFDATSHTLFASFKYMGYDYAGDMERMRENPKVREWWKMTDEMQESYVKGAKSSEDAEGPSWWKGLEEVFYYA